MEAISAIINEYSAQYEQTVIFGNFNMSVEKSHLQNLMQIYDLYPLIQELTCFQSHNPTCVDNFLTNQKAMFKLSIRNWLIFKNRFNKCRNYENWSNYKTQRNYCVILSKYFKNLNLNDVTDKKTFRRTIKPYFNEKGSG